MIFNIIVLSFDIICLIACLCMYLHIRELNKR
nr:MAG TPA: hypothetical protein [Caudoviricetes sp.]